MSFKDFSTSQSAAGKHGSADKPKKASPTEQQTKPAGHKPAEVAPAQKS